MKIQETIFSLVAVLGLPYNDLFILCRNIQYVFEKSNLSCSFGKASTFKRQTKVYIEVFYWVLNSSFWKHKTFLEHPLKLSCFMLCHRKFFCLSLANYSCSCLQDKLIPYPKAALALQLCINKEEWTASTNTKYLIHFNFKNPSDVQKPHCQLFGKQERNICKSVVKDMM